MAALEEMALLEVLVADASLACGKKDEKAMTRREKTLRQRLYRKLGGCYRPHNHLWLLVVGVYLPLLPRKNRKRQIR
jgi:hypothetical protein